MAETLRPPPLSDPARGADGCATIFPCSPGVHAGRAPRDRHSTRKGGGNHSICIRLIRRRTRRRNWTWPHSSRRGAKCPSSPILSSLGAPSLALLACSSADPGFPNARHRPFRASLVFSTNAGLLGVSGALAEYANRPSPSLRPLALCASDATALLLLGGSEGQRDMSLQSITRPSAAPGSPLRPRSLFDRPFAAVGREQRRATSLNSQH